MHFRQRPTTGIFVYAKPKDQTEKNHNKRAFSLIELNTREPYLKDVIDFHPQDINTHHQYK
ncbi:hypothetical protein, partial [Chitinophaga sp.]|uniref:hypothetical protein n=1 Tax=Chitinophaga sp. TaxID=1869181 RepID=UPI002CFB3AC9